MCGHVSSVRFCNRSGRTYEEAFANFNSERDANGSLALRTLNLVQRQFLYLVVRQRQLLILFLSHQFPSANAGQRLWWRKKFSLLFLLHQRSCSLALKRLWLNTLFQNLGRCLAGWLHWSGCSLVAFPAVIRQKNACQVNRWMVCRALGEARNYEGPVTGTKLDSVFAKCQQDPRTSPTIRDGIERVSASFKMGVLNGEFRTNALENPNTLRACWIPQASRGHGGDRRSPAAAFRDP